MTLKFWEATAELDGQSCQTGYGSTAEEAVVDLLRALAVVDLGPTQVVYYKVTDTTLVPSTVGQTYVKAGHYTALDDALRLVPAEAPRGH